MKKIALSGKRGADKSILVDDEDYERVCAIKWYLRTGSVGRIEYCGGGRKHPVKKSVSVHRFILGLTSEDKEVVDHINHNFLDNRKSNLRLCTHAENMWNTGSHQDSRSRYKGVSFISTRNKWSAYVKQNSKAYFCGYHLTERSAALAYNKMAALLHGEFACLNKVE